MATTKLKRSRSAKRTAGSLKRVVSYADAKNLKHLKDALGHLNSFDTSGLSPWNERGVNSARCYLEETIQRVCGK